MRLKIILAFALAAITTQATGMEQQSWASRLKNKIMGQFTLLALGSYTISKNIELQKNKEANDARAEEETRAKLQQDVERIVASGSTVQETETKRIREQHQKVLDDYKACACISDEDWKRFHEEFQEVKNSHPLFVPLTGKYSILNEQEEDLEKKIANSLTNKLVNRNLNFKGVTAKFPPKNAKEERRKRPVESPAAGFIHLGKPTKDDLKSTWFSFDLKHYGLSKNYLDFTLHHEITHVQELHPHQKHILSQIADEKTHKKCIEPFNYQTELEADTLYSLQDYNIAKKGEYFFCSPEKIALRGKLYYQDHDSHPSDYKRCKEIRRIIAMLEIEKELREKQKTA